MAGFNPGGCRVVWIILDKIYFLGISINIFDQTTLYNQKTVGTISALSWHKQSFFKLRSIFKLRVVHDKEIEDFQIEDSYFSNHLLRIKLF